VDIGGLILADLIGEQAEQVERIDLVRIRLKNGAIDLLRLAQLTRLMLLHRQIERLRYGEHGRRLSLPGCSSSCGASLQLAGSIRQVANLPHTYSGDAC